MKKELIKTDLKAMGLRSSNEYDFIFVSKKGEVYDIQKRRFLTPTKSRNYIKVENKNVSVPKLILSVFKGQKVRRGQIVYKDGNKSNIAVDNLDYRRLFSPGIKPKINRPGLLTVFRCYIYLEKNFNIQDNLTKQLHLRTVLRHRNFLETYSAHEHIEIFKSYVTGSINSNTTKIAMKHNKNIRDCNVIISNFIDLLIKDVFNDMEKGKLKVLDFEP